MSVLGDKNNNYRINRRLITLIPTFSCPCMLLRRTPCRTSTSRVLPAGLRRPSRDTSVDCACMTWTRCDPVAIGICEVSPDMVLITRLHNLLLDIAWVLAASCKCVFHGLIQNMRPMGIMQARPLRMPSTDTLLRTNLHRLLFVLGTFVCDVRILAFHRCIVQVALEFFTKS